MFRQTPRWIPLLWAAIELAVVAALMLFWHPAQWGVLFWLRGILVTFFLLPALGSLWLGLFGSNQKVWDSID